MGILRTLKHAGGKVASVAKKIGDGLADAQNKVSVLSPSQLKDLEDSKNKYYEEYQKDNPSSDELNTLSNKKLGEAAIEIYNEYLSQINDLYKPIDNKIEYGDKSFNSNNNIRYINITKWVIDKNENSLEKLVNVYEVLSNSECNIALVFDRKINNTDVYLAIINTNNDNNNDIVDGYTERMLEALKGNFPGSTYIYNRDKNSGRIDFLDKAKNKSVACISNIPAEKSEKFNTQTIEKLIDGIQPENEKKEWTLILLATPILDVKTRKLQVGEYYSFFAPYKNWETNYTVSESKSNQRSTAVSFNLGGNSNVSTNIGGGVNAGIFGIGGFASTGISKGRGINFGGAFTSSMSQSATIGKNEGLTKHFENYTIKHTLELLEEQMKRLEQASALGYWDFAAYVLSEDVNVVNNVAHSYLALTQGEKSYIGDANVNTWRGDLGEPSNDAKEIVEYLKDLRHPIFALNPEVLVFDDSYNMYPTMITATTQLSGKELAYSLNFPKKSISGLPVIECAEFGRNISTFNNNEDKEKFNIGNIFHMQHEENVPVLISKKSLSSHMFVTGSTGSGKSNTVYQILNEALNSDVKFMVVEPTKGEYKDVFCVGDKPLAKVYGTNIEKTPLLRINPFSFPKDIHVFEHMDRLVEIFNVCWPMYAAMPAVLKNAIEKSYEDCGWDLVNNTNAYGEKLYPSFKDVARNVKQIIDSSEYDNENKGAYKGSLLTRLESLTNGINGLLFVNDEIPLNELFDENVVIDISRVGSNETKSLIMGMLVLKLQEYRMANRDKMNSNLKHLTVLEEAHNLLKKTSSEISQDSGNLVGKSVEMISNAIAEMRTYGEGLIIVDQAPGLLDMASIRNTNTKIIMRLPDETDRKLVGKAANLTEDQIVELAKLPMGVGAIYQNEWIQPVLCKIHKYELPNDTYKNEIMRVNKKKNYDELMSVFELLSKGERVVEESKLKDIIEELRNNNIDSSVIVSIVKLLNNPPKEPRMSEFAPITASLFPRLIDTIKDCYKNSDDKTEWTEAMRNSLQTIINKQIDEQVTMDIISSAVKQYVRLTLNKPDEYDEWWRVNGGVA
ncbi:MAG: DUF87 domain-containing protein [Lachnospiraceae bacterium]|nr:DUF87 domain-containing protein [Lachnospiraceae bacterium]